MSGGWYNGSGKVCRVKPMILSMLADPHRMKVRMIMVDQKCLIVGFMKVFLNLLTPVITDMKRRANGFALVEE